MDNAIEQLQNANVEVLLQDIRLLQAPGRRAHANAANRGIMKIAATCAAAVVCIIYAILSKDVVASLSTPGMALSVANVIPQSGSRPVQLRFFSCHPLNLIYRLSLQTLFGIPGETIGTIPMIYSNYELEIVLRTINSSGAQRIWTDPHIFVSQEPTTAYMYAAALLTLPRTTLLYAWMNDYNSAYKLLRSLHVDVLEALNNLTMGGLRIALRALGMPMKQPSSDSLAGIRRASSGSFPSVHAMGANETTMRTSITDSQASQGLGPLLWPLMLACPGLVTCYLALALVEAAPLAAGWIFLSGLLKAFCEIRVLIHSGCLAWCRRPQAAVQSLACSHGVPFMLGCHALLLLRLLGALLPARVFLYISFHLYGTWVPLVSAGITLMALQPNNTNFLEGAMDGLLHLGHNRAAEGQQHPTADVAGNEGSNGANGTLKNRQHWPPPITVPAELQEVAESAPRHLLCPITHHILTEPAVTSTGATYERAAITEWLAKAGKDPLTGHNLSVTEVYPNLAMYAVVEEYVRKSVEKAPLAVA